MSLLVPGYVYLQVELNVCPLGLERIGTIINRLLNCYFHLCHRNILDILDILGYSSLTKIKNSKPKLDGLSKLYKFWSDVKCLEWISDKFV